MKKAIALSKQEKLVKDAYQKVLAKSDHGVSSKNTLTLATGSSQQETVVDAFLKQNNQGLFRVFVAGGARSGNEPLYQQQAFELGQVIGQKQFHLNFGLASSGIMGSVAKGVLKAWGDLKTSDEKPIRAITTKEYLALYQTDEVIDRFTNVIVSHSLEERKKRLLSADFVIFAPGGVGTLDELVYDCVAMQDGFLNFKPFVIFNVNGFFYHLLEFLKEIQQKGFASAIPFIVVDDSFEAGIAFDLLELFYAKKIKRYPKSAKTTLKQLIYILPYVIGQQHLHPSRSVADILQRMLDVKKNGLQSEKDALETDVETAYLNKEIERMYERLARAGKDTASVSDKLTDLRKRYHQKKNRFF